jgi:hypothetical protein
LELCSVRWGHRQQDHTPPSSTVRFVRIGDEIPQSFLPISSLNFWFLPQSSFPCWPWGARSRPLKIYMSPHVFFVRGHRKNPPKLFSTISSSNFGFIPKTFPALLAVGIAAANAAAAFPYFGIFSFESFFCSRSGERQNSPNYFHQPQSQIFGITPKSSCSACRRERGCTSQPLSLVISSSRSTGFRRYFPLWSWSYHKINTAPDEASVPEAEQEPPPSAIAFVQGSGRIPHPFDQLPQNSQTEHGDQISICGNSPNMGVPRCTAEGKESVPEGVSTTGYAL